MGTGLHPWEFYSYDLSEYLKRRKGRSQELKYRYQELLVAAMVPYMEKRDRIKTVNQAFKDDGQPQLSLKAQYERIRQRYINAGILTEDGSERN